MGFARYFSNDKTGMCFGRKITAVKCYSHYNVSQVHTVSMAIPVDVNLDDLAGDCFLFFSSVSLLFPPFLSISFSLKQSTYMYPKLTGSYSVSP